MSFVPKIRYGSATQATQMSSPQTGPKVAQQNKPVKKPFEFPFVITVSQCLEIQEVQTKVILKTHFVIQDLLQSLLKNDPEATPIEHKVAKKLDSNKVNEIFSGLDLLDVEKDVRSKLHASEKFFLDMCLDLFKDDTVDSIKRSPLLVPVFTGDRLVKFILPCVLIAASTIREGYVKIANIKPEILDEAFEKNWQALEEARKISSELFDRVEDFSMKEVAEMLKKVTVEKIEDLDRSQFPQDHLSLAKEVFQILKEQHTKGPLGEAIVRSFILTLSCELGSMPKAQSQNPAEKKEKSDEGEGMVTIRI